MRFFNKHRNVELIISQELIDEIGIVGVEHFPNEFGGFLTGRYSDDYNTLFINDFVLPKASKGSRFQFVRRSKGMKKFFRKLFQSKKEYYVGEWHTHPNGSTQFSSTDLNAMMEIESAPSVKIKNPVLLILSVTNKKLDNATFYIYDNKKLLPYE